MLALTLALAGCNTNLRESTQSITGEPEVRGEMPASGVSHQPAPLDDLGWQWSIEVTDHQRTVTFTNVPRAMTEALEPGQKYTVEFSSSVKPQRVVRIRKDGEQVWPVLNPVESPSGRFIVAAISTASESGPATSHYLRLVLVSRGHLLSTQQTHVSADQEWAVGWMETEDIVVFQSSKLGTEAFAVFSNQLRQIAVTRNVQERAAQLKKVKYGK